VQGGGRGRQEGCDEGPLAVREVHRGIIAHMFYLRKG
jgi:hypothetical protein